MDFTENLLRWYAQNKRLLPWRNTTNPYYIWLSEIILQQTRVAQGLPYYQAFIETFPTLKDLALAPEDQVLKLWQGLGYYSRARNLHHTAKTIYFEMDNKFPVQYKHIISLKGIGPYTATAIASFAFKEPVGVVDGNVFRVIARFFGIYDDIAQAKTRGVFQELVDELISKKNPDFFNHAIMDLGATVCTPHNPLCTSCPLSDGCYANSSNVIKDLPVKTKKIKVTSRYFQYVLLKHQNGIAIVQRTANDIWQQLYQFPLIETENDIDESNYIALNDAFPNQEIKKINTQVIKHKLSHQLLHINFYVIDLLEGDEMYTFVPVNELDTYAYPIVVWNFIKDYLKLEKN